MKYFYDTEFLEDGETIELISIGIVAEDGREYYGVRQNAPWARIACHDWLCKNVVPHLPTGNRDSVERQIAEITKERKRFYRWEHDGYVSQNKLDFTIDLRETCVKPKYVIANEVRDFLYATPDEDVIELWADYAAYDHVVLMQLWGAMIERPERLPMWTHDLQFEAERLGVPSSDFPARESIGMTEHHALGDARADKALFDFLYEQEQISS